MNDKGDAFALDKLRNAALMAESKQLGRAA